MFSKKTKIIIVSLITFILFTILVYIVFTKFTNNLSKETKNNANEIVDSTTGEQLIVIPIDKFNFDNISGISVTYNSDMYTNNNETVTQEFSSDEVFELINILKNNQYYNKTSTSKDVYGEYEVNFSNGIKFLLDNYDTSSVICKCILSNENFITEIPKEFKEKIISKIGNVLETNTEVYYSLSLNVSNGNTSLTIDDNIGISYFLEKCQYIYDINNIDNINLDYTITFNDVTKLEIDKNNLIGKLIYNNTEKYVKIPKGLVSLIEAALENNDKNLKNILTADVITAKTGDKIASATDSIQLDDIVLYVYYSKIDYSKTYNYSDIYEKISSSDTIVTINDFEIIIPSLDNSNLNTGYIVFPDDTVYPINIKEDFQIYLYNLN